MVTLKEIKAANRAELLKIAEENNIAVNTEAKNADIRLQIIQGLGLQEGTESEAPEAEAPEAEAPEAEAPEAEAPEAEAPAIKSVIASRRSKFHKGGIKEAIASRKMAAGQSVRVSPKDAIRLRKAGKK